MQTAGSALTTPLTSSPLCGNRGALGHVGLLTPEGTPGKMRRRKKKTRERGREMEERRGKEKGKERRSKKRGERRTR